MTHTDLIARLRDQQTKFMTPILGQAADALTAAQERIEALEDALRNVVKSGSHQQARMIARASLPFAVAYRRHRRHLTARPEQPIVSVPSTPAT